MDDGLLEVFGLKQGWHASLVMGELISAKHIVQVLQLCWFIHHIVSMSFLASRRMLRISH